MIVIILSNLSIQYNSLLSITLAIIFTSLQSSEFMLLEYSSNDSSYSSLFFCLTSLHFCHVFVGIYLLFIYLGSSRYITSYTYSKLISSSSLISVIKNYSSYVIIPVVNNLSLMYWHLIEMLWIFIDVILYSY